MSLFKQVILKEIKKKKKLNDHESISKLRGTT